MSARAVVVVAAVVAGLAVALAVTLLQPTVYRASGTLILTREGRAPGDDPTLAPAAAAAADLLRSRAVAESAAANLRLDETADELLERIDVADPGASSVLRFAVEDDEREAARRAAQEVAAVFSVLYNTRFGPETTVTLWEPPRAAEPAPRSPAAAALAGLGAAGLAGAAGWVLARRRRPTPSAERRPRVEAEPQWPRSVPLRPLTLGEFERLRDTLPPARQAAVDPYLEAARDVVAADGTLSRPVELLLRDVLSDAPASAAAEQPASTVS